ncbi:translation factor [Bimuria novae-zelandiae CBS 107.79]|uniref:Threonylcarbamoyl-AMP synthase n=1 Tax=Bimuria novae-zelandiae CBS 107.79 TaxID=1447943 RepID=A0A6A5VT32_9PLEO|nr:translation factor [Bimuria novae-zelandiae CBS 107.79]
MPTRPLRFPNVPITKSITFIIRRSHALAQADAAECPHTPPALNTRLNPPQFYSRVATVTMDTTILPVDSNSLGNLHVRESNGEERLIEEWDLEYAEGQDYESLRRAARELKESDTPVAFPTETVYGLGADATRSSAVRAIFAAKGRPADNPLIVHVHCLPQLRSLLHGDANIGAGKDPIPEIYKPLIQRFWPGPLTLIMPNPSGSQLAPEVTAGLSTFGARMPRSILALALIRMAGVPLAAPSANASTRPSPTAAEHVKDDLDGRIHTIIDGGPCEVGVESTVVDGLSHPPAILRPGGVTVEQLRQCPGWEDVRVGYKDKQEEGSKPRAPGMKYRHYSPKATVVLYEAGSKAPQVEDVLEKVEGRTGVGIVRTKTWVKNLGLGLTNGDIDTASHMNGGLKAEAQQQDISRAPECKSNLLRSVIQHQVPHATHAVYHRGADQEPLSIWDIALGVSTEVVARGLFSALRELDKKGVDIILVEGIDDMIGDDIAAAVMNRLRKSAEIRI